MQPVRPKLLAFNTALLIVLISLALFLAFIKLFEIHVGYHLVILIGILELGFSFFIIHYTFNRYHYSNVKLIYKNILQLKTSRINPLKKKIRDEEVVPEINRILIDWEKEQKEEIDHLKQLEIYRKEFLGNVSHELKTPIFSVQGYIHTLIDGGIEDQDINQLYLNKAAKSLDRLISIVEDLESISKLEAGELIIEAQTFDINDLTKEVIESLELRAKERNIILLIEDASNKPFYVYADKERIRQVLVNLMVNAIKYGKQNGSTTISFDDSKELVNVNVADDGIGIDKQDLPRLFERFYRVDKSRSREQGGTGLGLAIVKHIIEAHNQKIGVTSKPGEGTTFTFSLKKSR